jgi:hypothetical protein
MVIAVFVNGVSKAGRPGNKPASKKDRLRSLPPTAEILFISNRDTGTRRNEIYAMDADGGNVTRLTYTTELTMITGIDHTGFMILKNQAAIKTTQFLKMSQEMWLIYYFEATGLPGTASGIQSSNNSFRS